MLKSVWLFVSLGISPTRPVLESVSSFGTWEVFLTHPVLVCLVVCQVGSFCYTPRDGICLFVRRVECHHSFRAGICLAVCQVESFSYTPRAGICLVVWRLRSFPDTPRDGFCLVVWQLGSFPDTPRDGFCLVVWRLGSFPDTPRDGFCLVIQLVGSFSYTPRALWLFVGFGVSPTRPVLESVSSFGTWGFFSHVLCWSDHDRCLKDH